MSGFVYLWLDRRDKRYYVGSHWGPQHDRYICSSRWMLRAYKRRPHDFKRRIIAIVTTNRRDLLREETRWLRMIKVDELKVRYFNLRVIDENQWFVDDASRLSVGQKVSKALKGRPIAHGFTESVRAAISNGLQATYARRREQTGSAISEELRQRLGSCARGNKHTAEHKEFIRGVMRDARAKNPDWDKTQDKTCAYCGAKFKGRDSQKHCSVQCRGNHWYHSKQPASGQKQCLQCGVGFAGTRRQKFCSLNCGSTYRYHARGEELLAHLRQWSARRREARRASP